MRERLDCAILGFGDMADWCKQETGVYAKGRLYLHRLRQPGPAAGDVHALADMATSLQRFDVCLLAICEESLAWVRQAMLVAHTQLRIPVIGLVHNLKAAAIGDLYNLGMADFVRQPLCVEEVRIRTERLLDNPRFVMDMGYLSATATKSCVVQDESRTYGQFNTHGDVGMPGTSVSVAGDGQGALSDAGTARAIGDPELEAFATASASRCASSSESFGSAKGKVIGCFERAYIRASLAKSSGNIAMAARGAKKHRRAYWALMRKHNIDAAPYRKAVPPDQ